jgi:chromosome segregation ATPase
MINKLSEMVSGGAVINYLILTILLVYFVYKEWPEFRKRVSRGAVKEQKDALNDKTVEQRLGNIENEIRQVNEKLERDYKRLNRMETQFDKYKAAQTSTSEELEIIMRALLGVLKGMQEKGYNGPTQDAEKEIQEYLNKKAHHNEEVDYND